MADMTEVYDALRKADAAGDVESVKKLSAYIESAPKQQSKSKPSGRTWRNTVAEVARPVLEYGGLLGGGVLAGVPGAATGPGDIAIAAAGGTLGYAAGAQAADAVDIGLGVQSRHGQRQQGKNSMLDEVYQAGGDLATGATMEMLGPIAGKAIPWAAKQAGKVAKPLIGRLNATGTATAEQAIKAGKQEGMFGGIKNPSDFTKASTERITGEEIVGNAQHALQGMKSARGEAYRAKLAQIEGEGAKVDIAPIKKKAQDIFSKFVRFSDDGTPQWDRTKISAENIGPIKNMYETIMGWGSKKGDTTAVGVDMLKSNIDDLFSESNSGRALITELSKTVKKRLVDAVPQYAQLTKGYEEATKLIKDIESGLLMRKQGISGRIVADQTLRRLLSSMKDNYELRGELVKALSKESGADLEGQLAGHLSKTILPSGLSGTGTALAAQIAAVTMKPSLAPILATASPKLSNNFLRYFGQAISETAGAGPLVGRSMVYSGKNAMQDKPQNKNALSNP